MKILQFDGFEKYLQAPAFQKALLTMEKKKVEQAMGRLKIDHGNDKEFLSERTLIAVKLE